MITNGWGCASELRPISALFVEAGGVYFGLEGVDPWDESRDARAYDGPNPVVAHPPCKRWGRYWSGGPSARVRRKMGDDGGCFASALRSVRKWGGVLEHPEASHAWNAFAIRRPKRGEGWVRADQWGWTVCVEQGHYGHKARKATWLYAVGCDLPDLPRGPSKGQRLDQGYHSAEERARAVASGTHRPVKRLTARENLATPVDFRDLLLAMARSVVIVGS